MAVKPGTPHPTRKGLVMGKNGSYVSKTTYAKQVKAANAPKQPVTKPVTRSGPVKGPVNKSNSAVRLPNSSRAGVNLPRAGAATERMYASSQKPKPKPKPAAKPAAKPAPKPSGSSATNAAVRRALNQAASSRNFGVGGLTTALSIGSAVGEYMRRNAKPNISTSGRGAGRAAFNPPSTKPKPKPTASKPAPKPTASKPTASKPTASKPSRQNVTATKPKPKPKPKVSGVGPVASGRSYSVQKTGKSVMQQQADDLRAMQERSRKRQEADKKKKPAPRRNVTPRGPRERRYGR